MQSVNHDSGDIASRKLKEAAPDVVLKGPKRLVAVCTERRHDLNQAVCEKERFVAVCFKNVFGSTFCSFSHILKPLPFNTRLQSATMNGQLTLKDEGSERNRAMQKKQSKQKSRRKSSLKRGTRPQNLKSAVSTIWVNGPSKKPFYDDYLKIAPIGEPGQFGKAFRVKRNSDDGICVVKEICKDEIDILRNLDHRYIIKLHDVYESKRTLHLVMEECKGGELFDRIKSKGYFREEEAKPVIRKICEAIYFMHDKHRVVHCDLKPDNILFVTEAEDSDIKIIDFGMSKVLKRLDTLRTLCGTPYYTAPEVIKGDYTHSADMWSIGVIAYTMIFAMAPFMVDTAKYYGQQEIKAIYRLIINGFDPQIKDGYGAWFPKRRCHRLSEDGMDFIARLMEMDTAKRMTAREALQHQWLRDTPKSSPSAMTIIENHPIIKDDGICTSSATLLRELAQSDERDERDVDTVDIDTADIEEEVIVLTDDEENNSEDKPMPTDRPKLNEVDSFIVEDIMNFTVGHEFKLVVTRLFQEHFKKMKPKHFEHLHDLFAGLDTDGNGKISYEEFKEGMKRCRDLKLDDTKIKKMFQGLDVHNLGEFDFGDLINCAVLEYLVSSDDRLYDAFHELDINENGKIKTEELKAKIKEMNPYGNVDMLLQIIDDVDLDKDGNINYEEFLTVLHPDFTEPPRWFWSDSKYQRVDTDISVTGPVGPQTPATGPNQAVHNLTIMEVENENCTEEEECKCGGKCGDPMMENNSLQKPQLAQVEEHGEDVYIVKEGFMYKQGGFVRNWKKRWFELQNNGVCSYYESSCDDHPISKFDMKDNTEIKRKSWSTNADRRYGIKVYTPHRNWRFVCSNEKERSAWIQAFQEVHNATASVDIEE